MQVSIRKAVNNVFSEKYDKKNMGMFILISVLTMVIYGALWIDFTVKSMSKMAAMYGGMPMPIPANFEIGIPPWAIIPGLVLFLLWIGMWIVGTHNAIYNKPGVLPDIFNGKTTTECIIVPIKFIFGIIGLSIISGLIFAGLGYIPKVGKILDIIFYIFYTLLLIILLAGFYLNLKIGSLFDFKKGFSKLKRYCGQVIVYSFKCFCLGLLAGILNGVITFIIGMGTGMSAHPNQATGAILFTMALCSAVFGLFHIINIDLTAQLTRIVYPPKKKPPKQNKSAIKNTQTANEPFPTIDIGPKPEDNQENI